MPQVRELRLLERRKFEDIAEIMRSYVSSGVQKMAGIGVAEVRDAVGSRAKIHVGTLRTSTKVREVGAWRSSAGVPRIARGVLRCFEIRGRCNLIAG
jgi:hypothetical protein